MAIPITSSDETIKGLSFHQIQQRHEKNLNNFNTLFKRGSDILLSIPPLPPLTLDNRNITFPLTGKDLLKSVRALDDLVQGILISKVQEEHPDYNLQLVDNDFRYSTAQKLPDKRLKEFRKDVKDVFETCSFKSTYDSLGQDAFIQELQKELKELQENLEKNLSDFEGETHNSSVSDKDLQTRLKQFKEKAEKTSDDKDLQKQLETLKDLYKRLKQLEVVNKDKTYLVETLECIKYRSQANAIRLRLTQTDFVNPSILSEMSGGLIEIGTACALLIHLAIEDNGQFLHVINPKTNCFKEGIVEKFRSANLPQLEFRPLEPIDPDSVEKALDEEIVQLAEKAMISAEQALEIKKTVSEFLEPWAAYIPNDFFERIQKVLQQHPLLSKSDVNTFYNLIFYEKGICQFWKKVFRVECKLRENTESPELKNRERCLNEIRHFGLDTAFEDIHVYLKKIIEKLPSPVLNLDEPFLNYEAGLKQSEPSQNLEAIFNRFRHIIDHFIRFSAKKFTLSQPVEFHIKWVLDGVTIEEKQTIEKSCAIARRVLLENSDLPYFSKDQDADSVLKRWQGIISKYSLTDKDLATMCLNLFENGSLQAHEEIKSFAAFLVVLLLGKEPALDRASLVGNFIMLQSVKMGIRSFEDALNKMPMIPGGAVAVKQFILHTTAYSLDAVSWVRPSRKIEESYYLPYTNSLLGSAEDWLQKYDNVATAAVECCAKILESIPLDETDPKILNLKDILERSYRMVIPFADIPKALMGNPVDDEDLLGKWSINYLSSFLSDDRYPDIPVWSRDSVEKRLFRTTNPIDDDMLKKVDQVDKYLAEQGFVLHGVKNDGNCFFSAFLKSCKMLDINIPSINTSVDPISSLRLTIADKLDNQVRSEEIKNLGEWIAADGEGDLLAPIIGVPIRIVTVSKSVVGCEINDMLTFAEMGKPKQEWGSISQGEKPAKYILIVDLGGHFIYAHK